MRVSIIVMTPFGKAFVAQPIMNSSPDTIAIERKRALDEIEHGDAKAGLIRLKALRDDDPYNPSLASEYLYLLHFAHLSPEALALEHRRYGERFEPAGKIAMRPYPWKSNGKIRLGYLSPDLYGQASHYVILPILSHHDRSRFEIYVYSTHSAYDDYTRAVREHADAWRVADHHNYEYLRTLILADEIDILIDLAGHTGLNSLPVFAERVAPIQVSWFGYMDTTGLVNMDYRFTDPMRVPHGSDSRYSEKLIYLNNSYTFITLEKNIPRAKHTERPFTFGSFNSVYKINDQVLDLWGEILRAVPASRLVISACPDFEYASKIKEFFLNKGISIDRIEPRPRMSLRNFLESMNDIDIALDPFPYTGGVTTYHTLSQGVPTITLEGNTEYERNCAAILREAGLSDWIAQTPQEYVTKAISFSHQRDLLGALRNSLPLELESREGSIVPEVEKRFEEMMERKRAENS